MNIFDQISSYINNNKTNSSEIIVYYGIKVGDFKINCSVNIDDFNNIMDKVQYISKNKKIYSLKTYVYRNISRTIRTDKTTTIMHNKKTPVKYFINDKFCAIIYNNEEIEKEEFPIINSYDSVNNETITEYTHTNKNSNKSITSIFSKSNENVIYFTSPINNISALKDFISSIFSK